MNSNTMRFIAIALVVAALILTILDWQGIVIQSMTWIRMVLLILAVVFLLLARRGIVRS